MLTPISLTYLVMDDGNNHGLGFILNTHAFSLTDLAVLQNAMLDNLGIETSLHNENKIYIKSKSKLKFN